MGASPTRQLSLRPEATGTFGPRLNLTAAMNHVTPSAMTTSQRAMVAAKAKPLYEAEAKAREGARTDLSAN